MGTFLTPTRLLTGIAVLLSALPTFATTLDHLPPGTKWVMHVNLDSIKNSGLGKHAQAKIEQTAGGQQLDLLADMLNFDPRKDLKEATIYGPDAKESHAVLVVNGKVDGERLSTFVTMNETFEKVTHDNVEVLSWVNEEGDRKGMRTYGRVLNNQYVVLGSHGPSVASALKALEGGEVLGKDSELLRELKRDAAVMIAASAELANMAKVDPNNPLLRQAKSFQMSIREKGEEMAMELGIRMETPEAAQQLLHIGQGGLALLQLQAAEVPELQKVLGSVNHQMRVDLNQVKMDVTVATQALKDLMDQAIQP